MKTWIRGALFGISLVAVFLLDRNSARFDIALALVVGTGTLLFDEVPNKRLGIRLAYYGVRYRDQLVRVSVSYLFRIRVDGEYLLVKGSRWPQYQPVGGVYKTTAGAKGFLDEIGALDDDLVAVDAVSDKDLRIRVKATRLRQLYEWFDKGRSRESGPWREFYEELLEPRIVPRKHFKYIYHDYIYRYVSPIRMSDYSQSLEIFVADIFELVPTDAQLAELRQLRTNGHPAVVWATEAQIRRRGAVPGTAQTIRIGEPAEWTLGAG